MKLVVVDKADAKLEVKTSKFYVDGQAVPMRLMEMLVLRDDVVLRSKMMLKLSREGIAILMISKNSEDMALTLPQFSKNSEVKLKQYAALNQRLGMAKYFVDEKIRQHILHLKSVGLQLDEVSWKARVNKVKSVEELLGVEGNFSKMYFKHFFTLFSPSLHKGRRSKRPALDPVNSILSYAYSIVYNLLTTKLYMAGLEPSISYLHTPFRSHYALSSDFMELFRAKINEAVVSWFHDGLLLMEDFKMRSGVYLTYDARKKLWPEMKALLQVISMETDKEIALLKSVIS